MAQIAQYIRLRFVNNATGGIVQIPELGNATYMYFTNDECPGLIPVFEKGQSSAIQLYGGIAAQLPRTVAKAYEITFVMYSADTEEKLSILNRYIGQLGYRVQITILSGYYKGDASAEDLIDATGQSTFLHSAWEFADWSHQAVMRGEGIEWKRAVTARVYESASIAIPAQPSAGEQDTDPSGTT